MIEMHGIYEWQTSVMNGYGVLNFSGGTVLSFHYCSYMRPFAEGISGQFVQLLIT